MCSVEKERHYCGSCVEDRLETQFNVVNRQTRATWNLASIERNTATSAFKETFLDKLELHISLTETAIKKEKQEIENRLKSVAIKLKLVKEKELLLKGANDQLDHLPQRLSWDTRESVIMALGSMLEDLDSTVALERKRLVYQLINLFPIITTHEGETIGNLWLPSDLPKIKAMKEEERVAVLALIVRILIIVSRYLVIGLPFDMGFNGPKPCVGRIGEPLTTITGNGLALETCLIMLRRNVETLCFCQGIPSSFVGRWSLLNCMWQLFHSPSLGRNVQQSLVEAESRVGRVPAGKSLLASSGDASRKWIEVADDEENGNPDQWNMIEPPPPPRPSREEDIKHWESSGA